MLSSLLVDNPAISLLEEGFYIHLNALGQFVRIIVESVGIVGVGVIVFALILKAITTPFDIYQRIKMRKQTLIMRKLQPDLEKLQKQYANDKQTYQMKMMELQKKNGYSLFGACLPMIISLVILIVAITAFQSYAQYANLSMYEGMARAYNGALCEYAVDGGKKDEEGNRSDYLFPSAAKEGDAVVDWEWEYNVPHEIAEDGKKFYYTVYLDADIERMRVETDSPTDYLYYTYELEPVIFRRQYYVDVEKLYENQQNAELKAAIQTMIDSGMATDTACLQYMKSIGSAASAKEFREMSNPGFLWVKNVWYPDVSYNHPIQDYSAFTSAFRSGVQSPNWEGERGVNAVIDEDEYNSLTANLTEEKEQANGYFVMIIISIGLMLLSQFITMKSSKETNQYQTVDGQGARTQKVMMVVMPLMFALFGFMWSAAFTIYNIISSAISILVTLITNLIIGRVFRVKEEEELKQRYTRVAPGKTDGKGKREKKDKRDKNDKKRK